MRTGARTTVAPGIYRDPKGYEVRAHAAGTSKAKRFPPRTPLRDLKTWQGDTRKALRQAARETAQLLAPGTLAGDIAAYLATLPDAERRNRGHDYRVWITAALIDRRRDAVTLADLQAVVTTWREAGVAASTIAHRRRALIKVYEHHDGAEPPVLPRRVTRPRPPQPLARDVDMGTLSAILDRMTGAYLTKAGPAVSDAKAWLTLMLWTGCPPAVLVKIQPHDLDLEANEITKPAREKGRGAPAVRVPLVDPEGIQAARAWRARPRRRFSKYGLRQAFQRAVTAYRRHLAREGLAVTLPPRIRLYDLRHSFLTWLARKSMNPLVVAYYGQVDLATAQRYMQRAVPDMVRAALRAPSVASARGTGEGESSSTPDAATASPGSGSPAS